MRFTPYEEVNSLLDALLSGLHGVLAAKLAGLYLYGSLVMGDFDIDISDVDLLAATTTDVDEDDLARLARMHADLAERFPAWDGRVEVAYVSLAALQTFMQHPSRIARISPGEQLHFRDADAGWLVDWHMVRTRGVTLFGPPPRTVIAATSTGEFLGSVRENTRAWAGWVGEFADHRGAQAYVILTQCRALYAVRHGEQASKRQAALWAAKEHPQWAPLIERALTWRTAPNGPHPADAAATPEIIDFVHFAIDQVESSENTP